MKIEKNRQSNRVIIPANVNRISGGLFRKCFHSICASNRLSVKNQWTKKEKKTNNWNSRGSSGDKVPIRLTPHRPDHAFICLTGLTIRPDITMISPPAYHYWAHELSALPYSHSLSAFSGNPSHSQLSTLWVTSESRASFYGCME